MHRFAILVVLGFLCHPGAMAQRSAEPKSLAELREEAAEQEVQRQELLLLEQETAHAVQLKNPSFFRRVYGEDFTGTSELGQLVNKPGLIQIVQRSDLAYSSVIASDIRVRLLQDTAVVQTLWSMRGTRGGQPFSRQMRVIHVYVNGARGWQVIAGQQTPLPGEGR